MALLAIENEIFPSDPKKIKKSNQEKSVNEVDSY